MASKVKSTLILDTTRSHDPDGEKSEKTHAEDGSISLAAILKKYPARAVKWDKGRFAKLTVSQGGGVYAGNISIASNREVATEVFGFKTDEIEWNLEEVMDDMNCVYLHFTTGAEDDDSGKQSRWMCNVPRKSKQIHDHLNLEPLCLAAGSYKTAEEALEHARSISKKAKDAKQYPPELEVWSVSHDSGDPRFTIVLRNSMNDIQPEKFDRLKLLVGPDLAPTSSKRFQERTKIDEFP